MTDETEEEGVNRMLVFRNKGLIPEAAISTMGVNAKLNDNPIGQFGTGLKYAVAIVLRLGGTVTIWRGLKRMDFGLKKQTIRGQEFSIVTLNGRRLGFTNQIGLNWKPWMAYRELASNTHDEQGTVRLAFEEPAPEKGQTLIVVRCKELEVAHQERHTIFLDSDPLHVLRGVEVHPGPSSHVFYRGIRVMELPKKARHTYNLTDHVYLTEDRTVLYPTLVPPAIVRGIVTSASLPFLTSVLESEQARNYWEEALPYSSVKDTQPSDQFLDLCEALKAEKRLVGFAGSVYNYWADRLPDRESPYSVVLSEEQKRMVANAVEAIRGLGVDVDAASLVFKSKLETGPVQVAGRSVLLVDAKLLDTGQHALARGLLGGIAMLQGGSAAEQLACRLLTGEWLSREMTTTPSLLEDEEVLF